jgi:hypothetical protein
LLYVHLYTHEKMTENLTMYSRAGYVEYDRRSQGEFSLVDVRKTLVSSCHGEGRFRSVTIGIQGRSSSEAR